MTAALESQLDADVEALLQSRPEAIADPFPTWNRLRSEAPVYRHGPVVLVTRYDDSKSVIRDDVRFSHAGRSTGTRAESIRAALDSDHARAWDEVTAFENLYLSRSDDEEHARRRRIAHRAFTPRRIAELERATRRYAEEMITASAASDPADLMSGLAYRLPLMIICDMLGVPAHDRERIHEWSGLLGRNRGGDDPQVLMAAHAAMEEFRAYVGELLVPLRKERGTDLLSDLLGAEDDEQLSQEELTAMFVVLLFAGHETTTNLIGNGLLMLLEHRDQWERLCAEPQLMGNAVEELLRIISPVQWQFRLTTQPMTLRGVELPAGQTVYAVAASANRDPEVFSEPDVLDVGRENAKAHIALGFGTHFCLGNALARLEGQVVLELLTERYPHIELASSDLHWRGNAMLRGLAELPVHYGPAQSPS